MTRSSSSLAPTQSASSRAIPTLPSGARGYTNTWDSQDRLLQTSYADGSGIAHEYDADGRRVRTVATSVAGTSSVADFLVDPSRALSHVVVESNFAGEIAARYIRAGDRLLAIVRPTGTRYLHADHLGSTRALSDEKGALVDAYRFDAFGALASHAGSDPIAYLFAGEPFEPRHQLSYNRARWMDPELARFLSIDPLDGPGDAEDFLRPSLPEAAERGAFEGVLPLLQRYAYAAFDPVNATDPSGAVLLLDTLAAVEINNNDVKVEAQQATQTLAQARIMLARRGLQPFRIARVFRAAGQQTHHLIERRLLARCPQLARIWRTANDIPSANLFPHEHQIFTNLWRAAFPYRNQAGYRLVVSLEDVFKAANTVYKAYPEYARVLLLDLLLGL